jgi:hypothetical protein
MSELLPVKGSLLLFKSRESLDMLVDASIINRATLAEVNPCRKWGVGPVSYAFLLAVRAVIFCEMLMP